MKSQYSLHIDILNMCMRFMVSFSLMGFVALAISENPTYVWKLFYLLPAVVIIFIIEKYSKQAWIYFLFNIFLLTAYILIFSELLFQIFFGLYILAETMFQFFNGRRRVKKNIFPLPYLFILVMYLFCKSNYEGVPALQVYFFYSGIVFILLYILNMYFINFERFIDIHKDNTIAPLKQIKLSNNIYMGIFIYISYMVMLISSQFSLKSLLNALWNLIKPLLKTIFSYLANLPREKAGMIKPRDEEINYGSMIMEEIPKKPSKVLIAISQFIYNFAIVGAAAVLIILFLYGLYKLYKYFYEKKFNSKKNEEKKEFITPYEEEKLDPNEIGSNEVKRRFFSFLIKSNNDRIRKQYYKSIVNNTKQEEKLKYLVPKQLSKYAFIQNSLIVKEETDPEKEARLTDLYEKARYSNKECSKEEWHSVKNMLK